MKSPKVQMLEEALEIACEYLSDFIDALELLPDKELTEIMTNPFCQIEEAKEFLRNYEDRLHYQKCLEMME